MFCTNCGSKIDGMNFCEKCGTKIENTDTKTTIKAAISGGIKPVNENKDYIKIFGYILTFLPLLGLITMWIPGNAISHVMTYLSIGLWCGDKVLLKQYGYTGKWTWWGFFLIPVYLYFRCKKVDGNLTKFKYNIASLVLVFVIALLAALI